MVQIARHLFTVDEYHRMADAGIFREDDRVELIEGEIVEMTPIGSQHASAVSRLNWLFASKDDAGGAILWIQNPVALAERAEPQPDLCLLRPRPDFYSERLPGPDEVLLLIEVADSSLAFDSQVKLPMYAASGVSEVWIVDLQEDRLHLFRSPRGERYEEHRTASRGESVSPRAFPKVVLAVNEILGEVQTDSSL